MKKRGKKGQVTIFIIIAIFIVAGGILFFVLRENSDSAKIPSEVAPIKNFVDECIQTETEKAVYLIGEGGGYFFPPVLSTEGGYTYYFYEGKNYFPSEIKIKDQLSSAIESNINLCVGNFDNFQKNNIKKGEVQVETELLEDKVVFDVSFPLKIYYEEDSTILRDFGTYEIPVKLGLIHSLISQLIKEGYYTEDSLCIDCFTQVVYENNLDVGFLDAGKDNSIFVIEDYNEKENKTFEYIFAV